MTNANYANFGKVILVRAYFSIFSYILGLILVIRTVLSMFVPVYSFGLMVLSYISTGFAIIGLIIALLILITAKRLTKSDNHPFLRNFYSKMLGSFIMAIIARLYPILHNFIVDWAWNTTFFSFQLGNVIANILGLIGIFFVISAWSFFSKYSTDRRFNPKIAQGSNLIRTGSILSVVSFIFVILEAIMAYLLYSVGISYSLLVIITLWVLTIGGLLLDIIIPVLIIVGHFKVGKLIQTVTSSSGVEPTLGDSPFDRAIKQTNPQNRNICSNCGSSILTDVKFCPFCGNSV